MKRHYTTFDNMAREVARTGHRYFDRDTTRFFKAKYQETVCHVEYTESDNVYYLVESTRYDGETREYRTLCVTLSDDRCGHCGAMTGKCRVEISRYVENGGVNRRYRTLTQARKAVNAHLSALFGTTGVEHV